MNKCQERHSLSTAPTNMLRLTQDPQFSITEFLISTHYPLLTLRYLHLSSHNYRIITPGTCNILKMKKIILSLSLLASLATAYSGELTYFTPSLGSCGIASTNNDAVVALSPPMVCILVTDFPSSRTVTLNSQYSLTLPTSMLGGSCTREGPLTPEPT